MKKLMNIKTIEKSITSCILIKIRQLLMIVNNWVLEYCTLFYYVEATGVRAMHNIYHALFNIVLYFIK